ncbi:MAG: hypothetical protein EXX96DRAFT_603431 [Benjaminiella poitrasii]|nr:MAG: hypothetical protein EXX96DRAFT_603431 [Benjaminiella poitrasii]
MSPSETLYSFLWFYSQIVCPQLEYGLAVSSIMSIHLRKLEALIVHLVNQSSMLERAATLQAQLIYRTFHLPQYTLLSKLLPFFQTSSSISQWYKLTKSLIYIDIRMFKYLRQTFLQNNLESRYDGLNSKLLTACRPTLIIDSVLQLSMSYVDGRPQFRLYHLTAHLSRPHAIHSLHMQQCLFLPTSIEDLLSFLLNLLSTKKKAKSII